MRADQIRAGRALLGLTAGELAFLAGVTPNTISRIERGGDAKQSTMDTIAKVLEARGVQFIPENGGGAGVRLRDRK